MIVMGDGVDGLIYLPERCSGGPRAVAEGMYRTSGVEKWMHVFVFV